MTTQTEAQLIADALDDEFAQGRISNHTGRKAAAEMRRLESDKDDWIDASFVFKERALKAEARVKELEAANAELLESLVDLVCLYPLDSTDAIITSARAAIKKHGGAA